MIEFKNVVKQYENGFRAVDNLSLNIHEGEICVLIGPSGCGKTTSMRMVNRLISITNGEILIDGRPNTELAPEELRRQIGYAIQQIGLLPHMTIRDNVALVPRLLRWDEDRIKQRVDSLLDMVGIDPGVQGDKYPRQLSGGQQQRVGVARALGADPPIMLMDEPFGAVDPITRDVLQAEFLQIQEEVSKTIIFVTHDIDEAIKMGDRIALLRNGQLIQYDTPDTLLAHPVDKFARDFVGADRSLKRLGLIRVEDLMDPDPPSVKLGATIEEARKVLTNTDPLTSCVFVVGEEEGKLKGWVDRSEAAKSHSLIDAMYEAPFANIAVRTDATAREALSAMVSRSFRITPVVDRHGRLVGSISMKTLEKLAQQQYQSDNDPGAPR